MQQINKSLIDFLELLDTEMAQRMLLDLQDESKRTPQLYNAIGKLLDRHKFQISKLQPDESILGGLYDGLKGYLDTTSGLTPEEMDKYIN